jgi:dynein heavy chain
MVLEDMSMNLASMLSSRYVRPLLDEVRRWEARLGLIGEALAAWMAVQRKWIYLESIFASDDIRHQLPHVRIMI